jgi:hypothetical protein
MDEYVGRFHLETFRAVKAMQGEWNELESKAVDTDRESDPLPRRSESGVTTGCGIEYPPHDLSAVDRIDDHARNQNSQTLGETEKRSCADLGGLI